MADGYLRYKENYATYRKNQETLFPGLEWPPLYPCDSMAEEARR
jgi:hypothetical protein